jgi:hypothetical protein
LPGVNRARTLVIDSPLLLVQVVVSGKQLQVRSGE